MPRISAIAALILSAGFLVACSTAQGNSPTPLASLTALAPTSQSASPLPIDATTAVPAGFFIQPGVPQAIVDQVLSILSQAGYIQTDVPDGSVMRVVLDPPPDAVLTAQWTYALVEPFPYVLDEYQWSRFLHFWAGSETETRSELPYDEPSSRFVLTQSTYDLLTGKLGARQAAANDYAPVVIEPDPALLADTAWAQTSYSIIPFDQLEPRFKVLSIDGMNPLDKTMDTNAYPLIFSIGVIADGPAGAQAVELLRPTWQSTNRDVSKMDYVTMTGVTALSRAVAKSMETFGINYPAEKILPFIADADILHTSNEASFDVDCPEQDWLGDVTFCEHRKYYEIFNTIGLDIVELTGNHNLDYGVDAALNSLDVYDAEGLPYFGGGRNLEDAIAPRILMGPSGTRYAFIGCNSAGPFGAWASTETPGAAPCDDWVRIHQQIAGLKSTDQADVVIVTVQYLEMDSYAPSDEQRVDFEALSAAGADIVSGSQAHQPQGFSFVGGRFIHFGVGNVFFDQIDLPGNRQMFIDKHVFYNGQHISTILFTGWFEEIAQARPMTTEERADLLKKIFEASGW
jgi:hypothetical protein